MPNANISQIKRDLQENIGSENVSDDKEILKQFSSDDSIQSGKFPDLIVTPSMIKGIQEILKIANKYKINVIPSSSTEKYYGATIPRFGGIVVDLRNMNKILEIDQDERFVRIEAGVTYKQLQAELKKQGLRIMVPLGFPSSASVVSTYMERVPLLSGPKILLSEGWQCILNMQIVLPNGMIANTGSASWCKDRPSFLPTGPVSGPDLSRVFSGSQGTLGIVTDLIIKAKYLPEIKRVLFIPVDNLRDVIDLIYQIQYFDKGREFLGVCQKNLSMIIAEDEKSAEDLRDQLPPWLIVMGIEADTEEKYQIDLNDLKDFGAQFQTEYKIDGKDLGEIFLREFEIPDRLSNFRKYKGKCLHIPFYVNIDEIPEFNQRAETISKKYAYPIEDLYGYLMPIEQAHTCYYDFNIHYDPNDEKETEKMKRLYLELSEDVIENGGVIDRPYGPWAQMIYSRNRPYYDFWRQVKNILDPNEIMNPGQLRIEEG
ncbi:MAG: FAD-binding oxidoreductase [Candidatus Helarchaeota archaeon]|nr:FAD-binding oxidoreductase [Candidatus Helarchaeota archaeon]